MDADFAGSQPFRVFCSYSHRDDHYRQRLLRSLSPLRREGVISEWDDTEIDGGTEWQEAIRRQVGSADLILLLISSDFLHSDSCYGEEMTRALERHGTGSAIVIPVLVRRADWTHAPFSKLQVLPTGGKPLAEWRPADKGYTDVAVGIRRALLRRNGPDPTAEMAGAEDTGEAPGKP